MKFIHNWHQIYPKHHQKQQKVNNVCNINIHTYIYIDRTADQTSKFTKTNKPHDQKQQKTQSLSTHQHKRPRKQITLSNFTEKDRPINQELRKLTSSERQSSRNCHYEIKILFSWKRKSDFNPNNKMLKIWNSKKKNRFFF